MAEEIKQYKFYCADGKLVQSRINRLLRYINGARLVWKDDESGFREWANKTIAGALANIGRHGCVDTS